MFVVAVGAARLCTGEFARQHGKVQGGSFAILGMGKFGAREMTAASDLDVIFLYDAPADAISDGRSKLPAAAYYVRLSQRLITALSAPTARGRLYEVDARLRPSGIQGQLAVSIDGFLKYEREEAWTFERMARTALGDLALDVGNRLRDQVERVGARGEVFQVVHLLEQLNDPVDLLPVTAEPFFQIRPDLRRVEGQERA